MSIFVESLMNDLRVQPSSVWSHLVEYKTEHKKILALGLPPHFLARPEEFAKLNAYDVRIDWVSTSVEAPLVDEFRQKHAASRLYVCDDVSQFNTDEFDGAIIFSNSTGEFLTELWRVLKESAPVLALSKYIDDRDHARLSAMGMRSPVCREEYGYWLGLHRKDLSEFYKGASHAKSNT